MREVALGVGAGSSAERRATRTGDLAGAPSADLTRRAHAVAIAAALRDVQVGLATVRVHPIAIRISREALGRAGPHHASGHLLGSPGTRIRAGAAVVHVRRQVERLIDGAVAVVVDAVAHLIHRDTHAGVEESVGDGGVLNPAVDRPRIDG